MLNSQIIEELKVIIKEDYGRDFSFSEVTEIADGLIGYFDLLGQIYHREKIKNDFEENLDNGVMHSIVKNKKAPRMVERELMINNTLRNHTDHMVTRG